MTDDWIQSEIIKADKSKGFLILENPETKAYLDKLLLFKYWPKIWSKLKDSGYYYSPDDKKPETDFELSHTHTRSLIFFLLDGISAFFKGKLNCSLDSWMLESTFFLGLEKENQHEVIFEILGNTRFAGCPPELMISKNHGEYFQITFHSGFGKSWTQNSEKEILNEIDQLIDIHIQLYEFTLDGQIAEDEVGEFLTIVNRVYESY
ncbi:hypothetical protein BVY01_02815 [bacterium I07]|nr:hypothetical protein BVY01_02815 [bacterium I07]